MHKKSNVILITIDCLRADHLGFMGYGKKISPHIDDLGEKGASFHQAISNGPNTYCSFPSILTSSYPLMNQLGKEIGYPPKWIFLSKERATIAEVLKKEGYSTVAFHTNPWISSFFQYNRGFDLFEDFLDKPRKSYFLRDISRAHKILHYSERLRKLYHIIRNKQDIRARGLNQKALSWLRNHPKRQFFMWLHYMDVHSPLMPPELTLRERIAAIRLNNKISKHPRASEEELNSILALYDREIGYVDRQIGSFLSELDELGISLDNTYFIITADHGEQFMEHGIVGHGLLYDEILRVPLIMCGPGIEAKTVVQGQVSLLDLSPTIVELLNIEEVKSFCGKSLCALVTREETRRQGVLSENLGVAISFRTEKWKSIISFNKKKKIELYDLERDPKETENLAEKEEEKAKGFEIKILEHLRREEVIRRTEGKKMPQREAHEGYSIENEEQTKARLKALGYLG